MLAAITLHGPVSHGSNESDILIHLVGAGNKSTNQTQSTNPMSLRIRKKKTIFFRAFFF